MTARSLPTHKNLVLAPKHRQRDEQVGGRETVTLEIAPNFYDKRGSSAKTLTVPLDMLLEAEIAYPSEPVPTYPQTDGYIKNRQK